MLQSYCSKVNEYHTQKNDDDLEVISHCFNVYDYTITLSDMTCGFGYLLVYIILASLFLFLPSYYASILSEIPKSNQKKSHTK